jgi:hypothetical protein
MDTLDDEFYVTLVSNASLDVYTSNNGFKFTNILAKELAFPVQENWRVCLSSITLANAQTFIDEQEKEYLALQSQYLKTELKNINQERVKQNPDIAPLLEKLEDADATLVHIYTRKLEKVYNSNPIFVQCNAIKPKLGTDQLLSSFMLEPYDSENGNRKVIIHHPNSEEYFDLASNTIREITISLVSPNGDLVYDSVVQPTIVVLKFKKMAANYQNIYTINITNENGTDPTDFRVNFPDSLLRDGAQNPWEIAVSRVSLIPLFKAFPDGRFALGLIYNINPRKPLTVENWDEFFETHKRRIFYKSFAYNRFETPETLISNLNMIFKKVCAHFNLNGSVSMTPDRICKFSVKRVRKQPPRQKKNKPNDSNTTVETEELTDNNIARDKRAANRNWSYIMLPEELLYVMGFDGPGVVIYDGYAAIPTRTTKENLKAKRPLDLHFLKPQSLLLYTNCVVPSLVGESYGSYLTHIPIAKETDSETIHLPHTIYEPKNLEFHPLQAGNVNDIQIKLLKTNGEPPQFAIQNIKIFISLIFRLRPLSQPFPTYKTIKKYFEEK